MDDVCTAMGLDLHADLSPFGDPVNQNPATGKKHLAAMLSLQTPSLYFCSVH